MVDGTYVHMDEMNGDGIYDNLWRCRTAAADEGKRQNE
jgi:hypothetical protein